MAQQNQLGSRATTISNDGIHTIITYHSTQVVRFNEREVILDSGGWKTQTTKTRMNQASNQYRLGYTVYQKDFDWFVRYENKDIQFSDGMRIER